ncbi:MAG: SusC/RagA family TonB-linked outer membrane protein [Chitinophagaceae bacterium]|nr:SusC/RagA family TonB-linked outer membrane protein [Chitinophagaceae bacterium]
MRRFLSLFTMLMLCGVLAFAQSRVVSGKVTDSDGNPVPFATVKIKGSKVGLSADQNGAFSLNVKPGDVLEISAASFKTLEVPVGSQSILNTVMEKGGTELKEVVVTGAFGTKRAARSTASGVQNVSSEQLNTIRTNNINNALAGKVAGAQVRSQSAVALGRETVVRLRGENGLGVSGGPLYVVDGTIIPSSNDVNPDDVEDVTVLQGPAATALFGPDGINGAIVMNTKRSKKGSKAIGVEINSGVQYDKVYITPNYQNDYAGGADGDLQKYTWVAGQPAAWKALDGKYYHDYSDDASWGPRIAGQEYIPWYAWYPGSEYAFKTATLTRQPNNARDFYNTGVTKTNNINVSKAGENYSLRASYTLLDQKGLIPNEYLKRHTFNLNGNIDLTSRLTFGANVTYIAQNRNTESNDAYSNQSTGSFNQWFHRDLDMNKMRELRNLKSPEGALASWNHLNPGAYSASNPLKFYGGNYWYNFYSYFDNMNNPDRRDRLYGDVSLKYKITNDLSVKATYRKQQLTTNYEDITPTLLQNSATQTGILAYYGTGNSFSDRQNYEGLLMFNKKIKDFAINAIAGVDILKTRFRDVNANTNNGLNVPGLYSLANSKNPITYSNTRQQYSRRAIFVRGDIGFRNMIFAEGSYRRDYTSTLPAGTYVNTYSAGLSFVFSDLTKNALPFISYGKLRGSIGQTIADLGIYQLGVYYAPAANQWNGNFLMSEPNGLVDPTLAGSTNNEKELGLDMRFAKNRVGFSFTYWDRTNKNFPVNVGQIGMIGYTSLSVNAGEIAKQGVDVTLFAKPIKWKNLDWDINATWGRLLKNKVVAIAPGITRLVSASGAFSTSSSAYTVSEVGQPWGQMFGGGIKRVNGQPELTSAGLFIREADVKFGSVLPDYTGGVQNTFTVFKNFTVNVNIDYSWGGKFFSLSDFWGTFSGLTARTSGLNDKGLPIRDPVADGGGVHVFGVDGTGKPVDYYVDAQTYFHQFRNANISENSVYDLTFVKMRELSIGYRLPVEKLGIGKYVKTAVFSVVSRNPWLIYAKTKDFDPSEISNVQGEDGQFPGTRSMGVNLKLGF